MKKRFWIVRLMFVAALVLLLLAVFLPPETAQALSGESIARWLLGSSGGGISSGGGYKLSASLGQSVIGPSSGGTFTLNAGYHSGLTVPSTAVTVSLFEAQSIGNQVTVTWQVAQGNDLAAFNIYRADSESAPRTLLTAQPAQFTQGGAYTFTDTAHSSGCYWLEVLHASGATDTFGPVCAQQARWQVYLPVIK